MRFDHITLLGGSYSRINEMITMTRFVCSETQYSVLWGEKKGSVSRIELSNRQQAHQTQVIRSACEVGLVWCDLSLTGHRGDIDEGRLKDGALLLPLGDGDDDDHI